VSPLQALTPLLGPPLLCLGLALALSGGCAAPPGAGEAPSSPGARTAIQVPGAGLAAQESVTEQVPTVRANEAATRDDGGWLGLPLTGVLATRYRYRSNSTDDHDLWSTLSLQAGNAKDHAVTGHFLAWANLDLDGMPGGFDPFRDINDAYSKDVTGRLYEAFADFHKVDELDVLRLGRQPLYDTPEYVTFDGVRVETRPQGEKAWRLGAYGGIPVHHFESSSSGDAVVGTYVDLRPWEGGRARLDYMYLEDQTRLGDQRNDLLGARLWQSVGRQLRLEGAYSMLEGESRDVLARAMWFDVVRDLVLRLSYYQLLEPQGHLVNELDPFFDSLFELRPYYEVQGLVSKGFWERYRAELGVHLRRMRETQDEGEFNREFDRFFLRFVVADFLTDGLVLALTADLYDAGEDEFTTLSADLARRWSERWRAAIGTFYALYRFDFFEGRERRDVRVYFLDLGYDASKRTRVGARYEYEDDEEDDYHVLKVGVSWRF
jgi:hypothetical protein